MGRVCVGISHCATTDTVLQSLRAEAARVLPRFTENHETCLRITEISFAEEFTNWSHFCKVSHIALSDFCNCFGAVMRIAEFYNYNCKYLVS